MNAARKFIITCLTLAPAILYTAPLGAQSSGAANICNAAYEAIVTLPAPDFSAPSVWDAAFGNHDSPTQFMSGIPQAGGTVLALGRQLNAGDFQPESLLFIETDRRGRIVSEKSYKARKGERPVKMIRHGENYLVLSNIKGGPARREDHIRLSWYDARAGFIKDISVHDALYNYEAMAIIPAASGTDFLVLTQATRRDNQADYHSLLMRFTASGQKLWERHYQPGMANRLHALTATDDNGYLLAGSITIEDGRQAGWIIRTGDDGEIAWERSYPRGLNAHLTGIAPRRYHDQNGFAVTGTARPATGGPEAGWLMLMDINGDPLWQRYYRRDNNAIKAGWPHIYPDGRIGLALNVRPQNANAQNDDNLDNKTPDHIRLLTISPRGHVMESEAQATGLRSKAYDIRAGLDEERIVIASAEIRPPMPAPAGLEPGGSLVYGPPAPAIAKAQSDYKKDPPAPAYKGWVLVATPLPPYDDPCIDESAP